MQRLAKQFGISDVALAKTCRRAEIPVPKRGYWAKSQAGKKVTRIALPSRGPGVSDDVFVGGRRYHWYEIPDEELLKPIPLPAAFPDDIEETRKLALKKIGKIKVQSTIIHTHPLIARLLEEDNDRRERQLASPHPFSWDKPLFDTQSEQRRLRILNALFCALESVGFAPWLRGKDGLDLGIRVGGQSVPLRLEPAEMPRTGKKSEHATNAHPLCLEVLVSSGSERTLHSWSDVRDERIERMLRDIAVEIIVAGEVKYRESVRANYDMKVRRKAQLEEYARQRQAELERQERERWARIEKERIDRLLNDARALKQANEIRAYVEAVRVSMLTLENSVESTVLNSWCAWANTEADRLDPIKSRRFRIE
jgi:hypothetical protein